MENKKYSVGPKHYFSYGLGNFASQLSWTMVSTYLSIFYTDVFGLLPGMVSILFLVAKIWDGINDPMMGALMQNTNTKWGRFRPYIVIGSILLVIFTILTFTVPGFGGTGKIVWAFVTYICLGMSYTMLNVPYQALPSAMTREPGKINRLMTSQTMGMMIGMTILNLVTLPLVNLFDGMKKNSGYTYTAIVFACLALPMFLICAFNCKEVYVPAKEKRPSIVASFKELSKSKNMIRILIYDCLVIMGAMGRIAVAAYYYIHVVHAGSLTSIFMMMPMFMGIVLTPLSPKLMEKYGKRTVTLASLAIQSIGLLLMFFGPSTNMVWVMIATVIYGCGACKEPCLAAYCVDALDEIEYETGERPDGIAFSVMGLGNKIGNAIGSAIAMAIIGFFGYTNGENVTAHMQTGLNIVTNLLPVIIFFLSAIPVYFIDLNNDKLKMMREELERRKSNSSN